MKYVRILCAVALVFALCSAFTMKDSEGNTPVLFYSGILFRYLFIFLFYIQNL